MLAKNEKVDNLKKSISDEFRFDVFRPVSLFVKIM